MALKSGLAAQLGIVDEGTYGVPVTVTRFLPFYSESIKTTIDRIESKGIIAGRRTVDASQWAAGDIKVGGSVQMELYDHSLGILLKHMFGSSTITGAGPYTNTFVPGDLTGKSFTMQIGRPDVGTGTVRPFTLDGCKIPSWALECSVGEIATLNFDVVAESEILYRTVTDGVTTSGSATITSATAVFTKNDEGKPISSGTAAIPVGATVLQYVSATQVTISANATATTASNTFTIGVALASASYGTLNPVTYVGGSLSIAGSSVPVKKFGITANNGLTVDRRFVGSQYMSEPLEAERRSYMFDLLSEFTDLTVYNRYVNAGTAALVLTLASGANTYVVTSNVRFDGETPTVDGSKVIENPMKAVAIGTTDAATITLVTTNSDSVI